MLVDRDFIGNAFHNLMLDMAEDYVLTTPSGEEYEGKISLVAKTSSTYLLAEREYLMNGEMTFPDMESQTRFRGCYFRRQINPHRVYMLASTIPKDTTEYVANIYAVECNTTVDLAYLTEKTNRKGDLETTTVIFEEDVPVYWDGTLQKQQQSSDGNFEMTHFFMQIPARYGISLDECVIRQELQYNPEKQQRELVPVRYRIQSIDVSLFGVNNDKENVCGIYDVQMSLDTRG